MWEDMKFFIGGIALLIILPIGAFQIFNDSRPAAQSAAQKALIPLMILGALSLMFYILEQKHLIYGFILNTLSILTYMAFMIWCVVAPFLLLFAGVSSK